MGLFLFSGLIVSIIILSGIVSGSEAALLSISYAKAKELANSKKKRIRKKAIKLMLIKDNIQRNISTIVILNNIINIVGSIYVGVLATQLFGDIYLGIVSAILTILIIMFAEILPKIYGEKYSQEISLTIAPIILFFTKLFTPILFLIEIITNRLVKQKINEIYISEGEIIEMATLGKQEGSINKYESEIISNVFEMNDTEVYDIMVPKSKVNVIDSKSSFNAIVRLVEKTGHTRFPVIEKDEIIGIINAKDLFKFYDKLASFSISKILRPVIYAPESMKIFTLEEKLKKERTHIAIVVNEHGDFTGMVTLEDIIEELLGEIEDEFDNENQLIKKISETTYHIDASADIEDIIEKFNLEIDLDEDEDFTTVNGYLISVLGKIPKVNDKIKIKNAKIRVIKASKKKVLIVELTLKD